MSAADPTAREFAAIVYALALARGQLASVEMGQYDPRYVAQISEGTSLANIAAALGLRETDLGVDWSEHLSQAEIDKIAGRR